jgi:hypothetical protein
MTCPHNRVILGQLGGSIGNVSTLDTLRIFAPFSTLGWLIDRIITVKRSSELLTKRRYLLL